MRVSGTTSIVAAVAVALLACSSAAAGQALEQAPPAGAIGDTVTIVPNPEYGVGGLGRRLLGGGWRELWLTPVDAPVFDLGNSAGDLRIVRRGGGFQSITLHLIEEDGWREYRYRSVDKFPEQAMPDAIKGTLFGAFLQDQVSTLFPAAPLLVPPLLDAIGALNVPAELYVMPDDPRLGEHRETLAGMLGTFELKPDEAPDDEPGFAGARKIKGTTQFFNDLQASRAHQLDEREFLAVRLMDFLLNDTDRTSDNFEWARFGESPNYVWRPIARDRDRAFMDAGGWLNRFLTRRYYPKLVEFGPEFSLAGLTHTSYPLDRRLLQRLTRQDVERIALEVQQSITDDVIEEVIANLPTRWRDQTSASERLRDVLTARRARIPDIAREFYDDLVGEVDIHGTDEAERADVVRHLDGRVTVAITGNDEPDEVAVERSHDGRITLTLSSASDASASVLPFYQRTFLPSETNEIRLYLGGGNDLAVVRGAGSNAIAVRVIGGAGDDVLVDSAGGGATHFYDSDGNNEFVTADGTRLSVQPWIAPAEAGGLRLGTAWAPDWGRSSGWSPALGYREGAGLIVGFGPERRAYGFRRLPHHWEAGAKLLIGTGNGRVGIAADADHNAENSPLAYTLHMRATQLDAFRFYGYGNDTRALGRDSSLVEQTRIAIEPALVWRIGWRTREGINDPLRDEGARVPGLLPLVGRLEAGPVLYWSDAQPRAGSPLATSPPPGLRAFGRAGFRVGLDLERTDRDVVPMRGWTFSTELVGFPPLWDVSETFNTAEAVGTIYVPLIENGAHVALRAGGALASGSFPVQHAATLGGSSTLRGYAWQRFTGETSAYGSTELRVPTGSVNLLVRWQVGMFALADIGRVWYDAQSDGGWHTGFGGGLWLSSLGKGLSLAYARGEEHRLYLGTGASF